MPINKKVRQCLKRESKSCMIKEEKFKAKEVHKKLLVTIRTMGH